MSHLKGDLREGQRLGRKRALGRAGLIALSALAGILGPVELAIVNGLAASSIPQYNPVVQTISVLGLGPLGWIQTVGFWVFSLMLIIWALGLYLTIRGGRVLMLRSGVACIIIMSIGFGLTGTFQTDPPGVPHTLHYKVHMGSAIVSVMLFPFACFFLAFAFKDDPRWRGMFAYTLTTGILTAGVALLQSGSPSEGALAGLHEYILLANALLWLEIMSVWMLKSARRKLDVQEEMHS